jgi:hypothetical protein
MSLLAPVIANPAGSSLLESDFFFEDFLSGALAFTLRESPWNIINVLS